MIWRRAFAGPARRRTPRAAAHLAPAKGIPYGTFEADGGDALPAQPPASMGVGPHAIMLHLQRYWLCIFLTGSACRFLTFQNFPPRTRADRLPMTLNDYTFYIVFDVIYFFLSIFCVP